jgi:hypothetical protein
MTKLEHPDKYTGRTFLTILYAGLYLPNDLFHLSHINGMSLKRMYQKVIELHAVVLCCIG